MDLKALSASLLPALNGTPTYGANVNVGGGNDAMIQNIQNLATLRAQGDIGSRATGALGVAGGQQADNEADSARASAARSKAAEDEKLAELQRLQDPDEYKAIVNKVGGYDFFDPAGNKISAVKYAKTKNMQLTDVYKGSQDPADEDFVADYKAVTQLGKILQSGDKKARDKFYEKNPDWKDAYGDTPFNDIVKDLHREYPGYFRSDEENKRSNLSSKRTPNNPAGEDTSLLGRLKGLLNG